MSGFGIGTISGPDDGYDVDLPWDDEEGEEPVYEADEDLGESPVPVAEDPPVQDFEEPSGDLPGGENLVPYASFESARGWTTAGFEFPYDPSPQVAYHGVRCARLSVVNGSGVLGGTSFPVDAADVFWVSFGSFMANFTAGHGRGWLEQYDAAGALLQSDIVGEVTAEQTRWNRYAVRVSPVLTLGGLVWHPDATAARLRLEGSGTFDWLVDGVMATRGGLLTAFSPRAGEDIKGTEVLEGTLPGAAFDTTPPAVPLELLVSTSASLLADGTSDVTLSVGFTHPTDSDYAGSEVEVTDAFIDDPENPTLAVPVWSAPKRLFLPASATVVTFHGLRGATRHWARARSTDTTGNRSAWSVVVEVLAVDDLEAPGIPAISVFPMLRGLWVEWTPGSAADISHYEWRARLTGAADDVDWLTGRIRGSSVTIPGLTPEVGYDVRVRAVDTSGNVATSATDATAVKAAADPTAGWSSVMTGTPSLVGEFDITVDAVRARHIRAGAVTADKLGAGYIEVRTTLSDRPDGIKVLDAEGTNWYGRWDEAGLFLRESATDPARHIKVTGAGVFVTNNGGDLAVGGSYQTAITPDGIDASKVTFGVLPGGTNLILNSGFEQNAFIVAATVKNWDVNADWTGSHASGGTFTNLAEGSVVTNTLSMTATAF